MKILTAEQMREVDRRTIEMGIPGLVLMENAGHRVVEFLAETFAPLPNQRITILCGKGNNGGDGFVVARQLHTRFRPKALDVVLAGDPRELKGDALANFRMLEACRCPWSREIAPEARMATVVVDALLGTGIRGSATGRMLELIREINTGFPLAKVVALDIPSGMESDTGASEGETVRAEHTVTFTAPKAGQVLPPNCAQVGRLRVCPIGSPPELFENDPSIWLSLVEPADIRDLFAPREPWAHKGDFGHVLVVAGSRGKTGAAAMSGLAALRSGAGLVTVASSESAAPVIASHAAELMTESLEETESGGISRLSWRNLASTIEKKDVLAVGPGLGTQRETVELVRRLVKETPLPIVVDADGLNALSGEKLDPPHPALRVLTPHPGEMSRLTGLTTAEVQRDRTSVARSFARDHGVFLVLKGSRSLVAFPDGRVWVNPTGTPAMATGGTGDILTGTIAGLLAQFPKQPERAIMAAVYLHGLAGELGAVDFGEQALTATDLLRYFPPGMRLIRNAAGT